MGFSKFWTFFDQLIPLKLWHNICMIFKEILESVLLGGGKRILGCSSKCYGSGLSIIITSFGMIKLWHNNYDICMI